MNYSKISDFGPNTVSEVNNPLSYCMTNQLDQKFLHGSSASVLGKYGSQCQLFMSEYGAQKWDHFCEIASRDANISFPNTVLESCLCSSCPNEIDGRPTTAGDIFVHNVASRKYLVHMYNGKIASKPFDVNVASSPMISYYTPDSSQCSNPMIPVYAVNPKTIDEDIVMDKILAKPGIWKIGLINIYNTMKRAGTLKDLNGTKLGNFYNTFNFFKAKGGIGV